MHYESEWLEKEKGERQALFMLTASQRLVGREEEREGRWRRRAAKGATRWLQ